MGNLAGSGVVGFGMTFRALAVMVVVVALAATDAQLALAVVLLYALAYTLELAVALALYFSGQPKGRPVKRLSALGLTLFLLLPQVALASSATGAEEEKFNPEHDFDPGEWIPIHLGPLDLSINKTVAYLILGTIVTIALGLFLMRARIGPKNEVGRRQAVGEMIYDIAQTQVAEQGLPHKAIGRWFPYVDLADALHLGDQHDRLHSAAALEREVRPSSGTARAADAGHLRGHLFDQRHAGARADDLDLHAHRGDPLQRPASSTSGAGFPTCRRRSCR